jgi:hypothetical protein
LLIKVWFLVTTNNIVTFVILNTTKPTTAIIIIIITKIKQSRNRPGVAQRVPGDLGSQIFMTFGT